MDSFRQLQAEKWKKNRVTSTIIPESLVLDITSLESVKNYIKETRLPRSGILFGIVEEGGKIVTVDTIYECCQDSNTGKALRDSRLPLIARTSKLMGMSIVGILSPTIDASEYIRVIRLEELGAISRLILTAQEVEGDVNVECVTVTDKCIEYYKNGILKPKTTLKGQTIDGGIDGKILSVPINIVRRVVNTVVHTGFYRLNRPNHTPTLDDARAFLAARKEKAGIDQLHLRFADYHLIIFLADAIGELAAERIILSIFQEDDSLVEDLVELLMKTGGDI